MSISATIKRCVALLSTVALTAAAFAGIATTAQADEMQPSDYKVVSNYSYKAGTSIFTPPFTASGTVDLSGTIEPSQAQQVEGSSDTYAGVVTGTVEAADLFAGAYKMYTESMQKGVWGGAPVENLVMYSKANNKLDFPYFTYTLKFPTGFKINADAITFSENTDTISKISKSDIDTANNSVTFTFYLGNWNDYKGFFALVAKEAGQTGHRITVNVPYTVSSDSASQSLGTVIGSGSCSLYKGGNWYNGAEIISVTASDVSIDVLKVQE
ncbi:hypothetical protein [Bifidobacterium tsurumiense]|uniref:Uncharacterized protein n=1 Tax=Bifidobacterium tsurumiense TaxID=356829 RepID=A0A087E9I0_9BIFI|nr:hypothetical protein [Bifidobacterium tsurumiense]KFJ04431.1 hypothetical protein BITS_1294 [Bifidobacterium tsurumiense]MDY4678474.1 hypothetical protein [Bifidobacterium tsurumiense]